MMQLTYCISRGEDADGSQSKESNGGISGETHDGGQWSEGGDVMRMKKKERDGDCRSFHGYCDLAAQDSLASR
jgi:hypothetical protein